MAGILSRPKPHAEVTQVTLSQGSAVIPCRLVEGRYQALRDKASYEVEVLKSLALSVYAAENSLNGRAQVCERELRFLGLFPHAWSVDD